MVVRAAYQVETQDYYNQILLQQADEERNLVAKKWNLISKSHIEGRIQRKPPRGRKRNVRFDGK